jgi:hypothetical protein
MIVRIKTEVGGNMQEIAGDELVKVLQIRNQMPRRKALSSLEEKVLKILTENGFVTNDSAPRTRINAETIAEIFKDKDEDEEVIVDGEVDEGDVHIKPTPRKLTPLVSTTHIVLWSLFFKFLCLNYNTVIHNIGIIGSVRSLLIVVFDCHT